MVRGWVFSHCVVSSGSNARLDIADSLSKSMGPHQCIPLAVLNIDHQPNGVGNEERAVARGLRQAQAPLDRALEVLHLSLLHEHCVVRLEVGSAAVGGVLVGGGDCHKDAGVSPED